MSITRTALRTAAKALAQDAGPGSTATGVQLLLTDPGDYNEAIRQALAMFNRDVGNLRVVDFTVAATGFRFALNGTGAVLPLLISQPAAPAVALAGAGAGNVDNGSHTYRLTVFQDAADPRNTETAAGEASAALVVVDKTVNGKVQITIPAIPTGAAGYGVYRTAAAGVDHKLVGSPTVAGPFIDNVADANLGVLAPERSNWNQADAWVTGASSIVRIWWPYDATSQGDDYIDENSYRVRPQPNNVEALEFNFDRPAAGQVVRLEFNSPHTLDDEDPNLTSVRQGDVDSLIILSAAMILQLAAIKAVQNTGNTGLPNDVVDRRSQSDQMRSRAKELMDMYKSIVGKGGSDDLKGASASIELDVEPNWRFGGMGGSLWHPSRTR